MFLHNPHNYRVLKVLKIYILRVHIFQFMLTSHNCIERNTELSGENYLSMFDSSR